jgi:dihydrofolate reductase
MIIGIVAVAQNYAIGKDGKLPWHYSDDLKFFKETTTGNAIVMGSNTWRSIGKPLPNRLNVVLTRSDIETPPEVMKLGSVDEVIELSKLLTKDVFIIGGAKVFESFADVIDKWIVTLIPEMIDAADTFMPENFLDGFTIEKTEDISDGVQIESLLRDRSVVTSSQAEVTMSGRTWNEWIDEYSLAHRNAANKAMHIIGIPMIAASIILIPTVFIEFAMWRVILELFVFGWILQFVGHWFEGKRPEFFKDFRFLFVGLRWWFWLFE